MPDAKAMVLTRRCRKTSMPDPAVPAVLLPASRTSTTVAESFAGTGFDEGFAGSDGTALAGTVNEPTPSPVFEE